MREKRTARVAFIIFSFLLLQSAFSASTIIGMGNVYAQATELPPIQGIENRGAMMGVNMRGYYTNLPQERNFKAVIPSNYYEESFRILAESGINLVRYLFFWESYERNPVAFLNELKTVAQTSQKWNVQVIYANDQYHTSSWLEPKTATGFPASLFNKSKEYYGTGGSVGPKDVNAKKWWTDWLNRDIKIINGTDGWDLQAQFLKKVVSIVDKYPSTLGYEILNEPHVSNADQWEKIGKYNTFITDQLRTLTQKIIFYDRQVPADVYGPIAATPENMAKMSPTNKNNVVFKATLYGVPFADSYAEDRLNTYAKAAHLAGVPLCMCEFNMKPYKQFPGTDVEANQTLVNLFIDKFNEVGVWGWAYWLWNFQPHTNPNYNLINVTKDDTIHFTENFNFIQKAISNLSKTGNQKISSQMTDDGSPSPPSSSSSSSLPSSPLVLKNIKDDTIFPTVYTTTIQPIGEKITVAGQAFDLGSDIKDVRVRIDNGSFRTAMPDQEKGWLYWNATIPATGLKQGEHEAVARATDNANHTKSESVRFKIE
jgi:Cellulase (glycosyl hydrolase family 5)